MRTSLLFGAALFLSSSASWGQQTGTQQQTTQTRRRPHGTSNVSGGGRGGSGRGDDAGGVTPMNELPCPKGTTAQVDGGPHLQTTAAAQGRSARQGVAGQAPKKTLARRCVPDKPAKAAAAPAQTPAKAQ